MWADRGFGNDHQASKHSPALSATSWDGKSITELWSDIVGLESHHFQDKPELLARRAPSTKSHLVLFADGANGFQFRFAIEGSQTQSVVMVTMPGMTTGSWRHLPSTNVFLILLLVNFPSAYQVLEPVAAKLWIALCSSGAHDMPSFLAGDHSLDKIERGYQSGDLLAWVPPIRKRNFCLGTVTKLPSPFMQWPSVIVLSSHNLSFNWLVSIIRHDVRCAPL